MQKMHTYLYASDTASGLQWRTSDRGFFQRAGAGKLSILTQYDAHCVHGSLPRGEHRSYWMLTSNLGDSKEDDHLFLQAIGLDGVRSQLENRAVLYCQGYVSDPANAQEEESLYGPALLNLLRTSFPPPTMAGDRPEAVDLAQMPTEALEPLTLPTMTLKAVLQILCYNNDKADSRLILRIPATGKDALHYCRELILSIYQRLPYAMRKSNGFITGGSKSIVTGELPQNVKLILVDGDGWPDAPWNLANPEDSDLYFDLDSLTSAAQADSNQQVLTFLASEKPAQLDAFFSYCRDYAKKTNSRKLSLSDYYLCLDLFQQGRSEPTPESIRMWAAKMSIGTPNPYLCQQLSQWITPEVMAYTCCSLTTDYSQIRTLGNPDEKDKALVKSKDYGQVQDENLALCLSLAETFQKTGFYTESDLNAIANALLECYLDLAEQLSPDLKMELIPISGVKHIADSVKQSVFAITVKAIFTALCQVPPESITRCEERIAQVETQKKRILVTGQTDDTLENTLANWKQILETDKLPCRNFEELLKFLGRMDRLELHCQLRQSLLQSHSSVHGTVEELELYKDRLAERAQMHTDEQDLIRQTVASTKVSRIPKKFTLPQMKNRLTLLDQLDQQGLVKSTIIFDPWNAEMELKNLKRSILALEQYKAGDPQPTQAQLQWMMAQYSDQFELMYQIAQAQLVEPEIIVPLLAKSGDAVTPDQIYGLFLMGCPQKLLTKGAGIESTPAWMTGVQSLFAPWTPLPKPEPPKKLGETLVAIFLPMTLCLVGLCIPGFLFAAHCLPLLALLIMTPTMALGVLVSTLLAWLLPKSNQE